MKSCASTARAAASISAALRHFLGPALRALRASIDLATLRHFLGPALRALRASIVGEGDVRERDAPLEAAERDRVRGVGGLGRLVEDAVDPLAACERRL